MAEINQDQLALAKAGNMTALSRLVREHTKPVIDKALAEFVADEGKHATEKNNPWRPGPSFNVTAQGRIFKVDPALAARLCRSATGRTLDGKKIA